MSYPLLPSSPFYPLSFRISIFFFLGAYRDMYTYLAETEHSFLVSVALAITLSMFIYTFCFFLYTHILSTTLSTHASPTPLQPTSLHCSYFFFIFIIFCLSGGVHTDSFFQYSSFFLLTCVVSACTLP